MRWPSAAEHAGGPGGSHRLGDSEGPEVLRLAVLLHPDSSVCFVTFPPSPEAPHVTDLLESLRRRSRGATPSNG